MGLVQKARQLNPTTTKAVRWLIRQTRWDNMTSVFLYRIAHEVVLVYVVATCFLPLPVARTVLVSGTASPSSAMVLP